MKDIAMRPILIAAALSLLAGCTIVQQGAVTTVKVDVVKTTQLLNTTESMVKLAVSLPSVQAILGGNAAKVEAHIAVVEADVNKAVAGLGSGPTLTLDATSAKSITESILSDVQVVLADLQDAASLAPGPLAQQAAPALSSAQLVVGLLQAGVAIAP